MTTIGSLGDLHPYIALALEMKKRYIEPVIATSNAFRDRIESLGIEFHPIRPVMPEAGTPEFLQMVDGVVDPNHGAEYLFKRMLVPAVRGMYHDLMSAIKGADLLVTHSIVLAGPLVAQKTGIPWISTVLSPSSLWSAFDPFVPPNAPWLHRVLTFFGPSAASAYQKFIKLVTNPWLVELYEFREDLGLPPGGHPLFEGQFSPTLTLALFSSVLAAPQPDWPRNVLVTGFVFYNGLEALQPELDRFLNAGPPPVVFTLGTSAVAAAGRFYEESVDAVRRLGIRAVLLTGGFEQNQPRGKVPSGVMLVDRAPHQLLFPRAAAVVHQGGAGTLGQALRAGKPMLVVPHAYDQPDNASRVTRLGVARTLRPRSYRGVRVARELGRLLSDSALAARASEVATVVRAEGGARAAAAAIAAVSL